MVQACYDDNCNSHNQNKIIVNDKGEGSYGKSQTIFKLSICKFNKYQQIMTVMLMNMQIKNLS